MHQVARPVAAHIPQRRIQPRSSNRRPVLPKPEPLRAHLQDPAPMRLDHLPRRIPPNLARPHQPVCQSRSRPEQAQHHRQYRYPPHAHPSNLAHRSSRAVLAKTEKAPHRGASPIPLIPLHPATEPAHMPPPAPTHRAQAAEPAKLPLPHRSHIHMHKLAQRIIPNTARAQHQRRIPQH